MQCNDKLSELCPACNDESPEVDSALECGHGPFGKRCRESLEADEQMCPICVAPPWVTLAETMATEKDPARGRVCDDKLAVGVERWVVRSRNRAKFSN